KAETLASLDRYLEAFAENAERAGARVHWARDAGEACEVVVEILRAREAAKVVKSKSMATEEIHLNAALAERGVKAVETDLGEWILQLAGEHPSHLIAPAIHKTREEIATIISDALGLELPADPQVLVAAARQELRRAFIEAGMGISGANFAIAETGTIGIVTNEGNADLVTTLPPIHVAVFGVEKIVPRLDDAATILKLLPRSGTAQQITSYVSFITGPSRSSDIELVPVVGVHGPKELHLVLLDNGRMAAREDPELRETLHCIRCGACSNVCPPYQIVGGHLFGYIYTGPIGLPLTAIHHGLNNAADPQSLCVSCNACATVCPAEIPIPQLILNVRSRVWEQLGPKPPKEMVFNQWTEPERGQRWARRAALASLPLKDRAGFIDRIPLQSKLTAEGRRDLRAPTRRPLRDRVRQIQGERAPAAPPAPRIPSQAAGLTVAYFPGCMTDWLLPEIGQAAIRVLQACGCAVFFPPEQHCCGLVALNSGDRGHGRLMARQTIAMLERVEADWVLSTSTSCFAAMVQDYQQLFADDPAWRERAAAQAARLIDFSTFLDEVAKLPPLEWALPGPRVTYHDSCQSYNALGIAAGPRRIITEVLGLELTEMADASVCCGFGGSFSVDYPRVSTTLAERKLANAEPTGAEVLVADNPGCLMQLQGVLHAQKSPLRAMHLAQLIDERLRDLPGR
ncbi:MAG TPA: LUD domain-containing protein, partial [Thermomicrobiaceae bacterium]|nr:LUD domain-containing protein [Thermomicrobiaceae bacterium]